MARTYVDDNAEMWRVVVLCQKDLGANPNFDWRRARECRENGILPRIYSETETMLFCYGPYKSEGSAKGQLKFRLQDTDGNPFPGVISGQYQKAEIQWVTIGGIK